MRDTCVTKMETPTENTCSRTNMHCTRTHVQMCPVRSADLKYWNLNTLQQEGPLKDRLPHENNKTYGLPCLV